MKKVYGREWFSEKVDRVYASILEQNGPDGMEDFYRFVAGKIDLHHDGAVALLQTCTNAQLKMVFITGNDAEYVRIFLNVNGLANANTEIFGGRFEVKDHRYTGKSEGVNMGAEGKAAVVQRLRKRHPNTPVVLAMGDDEADLCLFQAAAQDGGICVMVGDDRRLNDLLLEDGFSIFKSIEAYDGAKDPKKVLQVDARPSPGKITLADVNASFGELIKPAS